MILHLDFGAMPPSYDDVMAAGSSVLVRPSTSLSRQTTPFAITTPPSNAAPFPVIAEDDNLDEFNDPNLQGEISFVVTLRVTCNLKKKNQMHLW